MKETPITTRILAARKTDTASVWIAAILIPLFLIAPALWNGYPLLQWDTGGYLARWYEGYLVPSRSTVFGLYLHLGEGSDFWLDLLAQALATLWILQLTLRVLGLSQPFRLLAISLLAGADHGATLARQHAADRHFRRPVGAVAVHPDPARRQDRTNREMPAVRLHGVCGRDPQRHLWRAVRPVLPRMDCATFSPQDRLPRAASFRAA